MLFSYIYLLLIYLLINIYWYNYMACNILMKLMFKNNYEKNIHTYIFIYLLSATLQCETDK